MWMLHRARWSSAVICQDSYLEMRLDTAQRSGFGKVERLPQLKLSAGAATRLTLCSGYERGDRIVFDLLIGGFRHRLTE